jgi:hypothetical protein
MTKCEFVIDSSTEISSTSEKAASNLTVRSERKQDRPNSPEQIRNKNSKHKPKGENSITKNNKWFKLGGAAVLGLMILGFAVPSGQTAPSVTLTALVQDQQCLGGDFVNVTLTATLNPPQQNVRYQVGLQQ